MRFRNSSVWLGFLLIIFFLGNCTDDDPSVKYSFIGEGEYLGEYFPTNGWRYCSPEEVGMDTEKLKEVRDYAATTEYLSDGLIIIKDGYIVCEDYFGNFSRRDYHTSYSVAKSFISATMGIAIDKGYVNGVEDKVCNYLSQLNDENVQPEKKEITVWNLLTMSAGFEWNEDDYSDYENNDVYVMAGNADNFIEYVLAKDIIHTPGTYWHYNSGVSMLISGVIEAAVDATAFSFAEEHLFTPIGIQEINWETDNMGQTVGGWGVNAPLYEFAKFGYLYLNKGNWDGNQVISESWINESVSPVTENITYYGYQWWLSPGFRDYTNDGIPEDTYMALGIRGQYILIIPSKNLVIVRMGHEAAGQAMFSKKQLMLLTLAAIND